jgi:hypothetical protein
MKLITLVFLGLLFFMGDARSFIYQLSVLRAWQPQKNAYQYVVGLGDWHDKQEPITHVHRDLVNEFIAQADKRKTVFILEDLSADAQGNNARCKQFPLNTRGGLLGGVMQQCKACNAVAKNVEYRFCRVAALGSLLGSKSLMDAARFGLANTLSMEDIFNELQAAYQQSTDFTHAYLQAQAARVVKEGLKRATKLGWKRAPKQTIGNYLAAHQPEKREALLKEMLIFDSGWLDIKIAHEVLQATDKNMVVILAGGTHIDRSADLLTQMGYERVYASPLYEETEYDLSKCVGTHITDGSYCKRPRALSVDLLNHYMHINQ